MPGVEEAAYVVDVVLDGRLHALGREGHDGDAGREVREVQVSFVDGSVSYNENWG